MVNNEDGKLRLQQPHLCDVVVEPDGRSIITNGPVYCLETAKKNYSDVSRIFVLNDSANADLSRKFSPKLEEHEIIPFINALTVGDRTSSERCKTSVKMMVDCDAYAMRWNRYSQKRWSDAPEIYVKFGFVEPNKKLLVISFHPSIYNG